MKKIETKEIGFRIRALRRQGDLTQTQLAEKLSIDRSTLSKIESGVITPTAQILADLKSIFAMSIDWLLTGEGINELYQVDKENQYIKEMAMDMAKSNSVKHAVVGFYLKYRMEYLGFLNLPLNKQYDNMDAADIGGSHG
ncbi:MAG: helix-turn-helix transcriptional regulator [Candidatus Aminicenantes bacterium]|nr:helix-turn-helix transcriptional regulator [Candidatus Aminicenantes bacterium]